MPRWFLVLVTSIFAMAGSIVQSQNAPLLPDPAHYQWVEVAKDFDSPIYLTNAGDDRLFVAEQGGLIWIIEDGEVLLDPFLDISMLLSDDVFAGGYTERGLLGVAFHPDYTENGLFFVSYTDVNGDSVIARYHVSADDPNLADPDSATTILTVDQPFADHNGGYIGFGPDGYLYICFGDGGSLDDPSGNGQKTDTFLSKILRIDVNADTYVVPPTNPFVGNPDYLPEIWAVGVRNPWRISFDRATGDLYIGDVGQADWEEVDFQPADSKGGENYGWSAFQGTHPFKNTPISSNVTMPVYEFSHVAGCSITGGYVYRGEALPELQGVYFFGDYCTGHIWTMIRDETGMWRIAPFMDSDQVITSFGEDSRGELYTVDYKGTIYRLEAAP
jgi:glucose/arabinose dehydrogenase